MKPLMEHFAEIASKFFANLNPLVDTILITLATFPSFVIGVLIAISLTKSRARPRYRPAKKEVLFWESLAREESSDQSAIGIPQSPRFVVIEVSKGLILDVGCGYGRHAVPLAEKRKVVCLDSSPAMISRLKINASKEKVDLNLYPLLGCGQSLPVRNGSFDSVICMATLYYIRRWQGVVSEISRATKRGGFVKLDFRGLSFYNIVRKLMFRTVHVFGKGMKYDIENYLTARTEVITTLRRSGLSVQGISGWRTRFLVKGYRD